MLCSVVANNSEPDFLLKIELNKENKTFLVNVSKLNPIAETKSLQMHWQKVVRQYWLIYRKYVQSIIFGLFVILFSYLFY